MLNDGVNHSSAQALMFKQQQQNSIIGGRQSCAGKIVKRKDVS